MNHTHFFLLKGQRSDTDQSLFNLSWVKIGLAKEYLSLRIILQYLNAKFDIIPVQWVAFTADIAHEFVIPIPFLCVGWVFTLSLPQGHNCMPLFHLGSKYYT